MSSCRIKPFIITYSRTVHKTKTQKRQQNVAYREKPKLPCVTDQQMEWALRVEQKDRKPFGINTEETEVRLVVRREWMYLMKTVLRKESPCSSFSRKWNIKYITRVQTKSVTTCARLTSLIVLLVIRLRSLFFELSPSRPIL